MLRTPLHWLDHDIWSCTPGQVLREDWFETRLWHQNPASEARRAGCPCGESIRLFGVAFQEGRYNDSSPA
jgi:hypothetical protein